MPRTWSRLCVTAVAVALAVTGCSSGGTTSQTSDTLTITSLAPKTSFDTDSNLLGNDVVYWEPVFDTLLSFGKDKNLEPDLATSWSYNTEETELTVNLRAGVKFSDGTPFDADAVKVNLDHSRSTPSMAAQELAAVTDVSITSPEQVVMKLRARDPALLPSLALVGGLMASPKSIAAGTLAKEPVGTGPYTYDAANSGVDRQAYVRNPEHWNKDAYPYEKVVVRAMSELTPRLNAIKNGEIDATQLSPASSDDARGAGLSLYERAVNWSGFVIADRQGSSVPALGDVRVRQALNYALGRDELVEGIMLGAGTPTTQIFAEDSAAYDSDLDNRYPHDPAKAKALLSEAGYPNGLELTVPDWFSASAPGLAPALTQQLGEAGITINWEKIPPSKTVSELSSGKYPIFYMQLGSRTPWEDIVQSVVPAATWNPMHARSEQLEALLAKARSATGETYDAALQDIDAWLVDNAWFAPVGRQNNVFATRSNVGVDEDLWGVMVNPSLRAYTQK